MTPPVSGNPWGPEATPYEAIGGEDAVRSLVEAFYDRIDAESPVLRAMLPRDDSGSRQKLYEFLSGWMGGPDLYVEKRGHPQLRMRHFPFPIGDEEAKEWMRCMRLAMEGTAVRGDVRGFLEARLVPLADHMVNR
jgi:hemoglobin